MATIAVIYRSLDKQCILCKVTLRPKYKDRKRQHENVIPILVIDKPNGSKDNTRTHYCSDCYYQHVYPVLGILPEETIDARSYRRKN